MYKASDGDEYFLEIINKDNILFGLCRQRIFDNQSTPGRKEGDGGRVKAFIRELHVYGKSLEIGEKAKTIGQHSGMGKELLAEAEKITKQNKIKELNIISGVGVREYYKKLGYKLDKNKVYMIKTLK